MKQTIFILIALIGLNAQAEVECGTPKENVKLIKTFTRCIDASETFDRCSTTTIPSELIAEREAVTEVCLGEHADKMTNDDFMMFNYIQKKCTEKFQTEAVQNKKLMKSHCDMEGAKFLNLLLAPYVEPVI